MDLIAESLSPSSPGWLESFRAWRAGLGPAKSLALAMAAAALIGVTGQIRIPLPFTPVPLTLQTTALDFTALMLGVAWGPAAVALFLGLGALGVPWFSGMKGGGQAMTGPTGGYLAGFLLCVAFLAWCYGKFPVFRRFFPLAALIFAAHLLCIHIPGLTGLWMFKKAAGQDVTLAGVVAAGAYPFFMIDFGKSLVAAAIMGKWRK